MVIPDIVFYILYALWVVFTVIHIGIIIYWKVKSNRRERQTQEIKDLIDKRFEDLCDDRNELT